MIFNNVVISANKFNDGHRSGPLIDLPQFGFCRGGKYISNPTCDSYPDKYISEGFWGGFIHPHFGHFIPEHTTRLIHARPTDTVIFVNYFNTVPKIFFEICELYKITPYICSSSIVVGRLTIYPQMEQYELPNTCRFPSKMQLRKLPKAEKTSRTHTIFISRECVNRGNAGIAGESVIADALQKRGVTIVTPDTITIAEQHKIYSNASNIIITEGSALYGLNLVSKLGNITVICRRRKFKMNWQSLIMRATSVRYIDVIEERYRVEECNRFDMVTINPEKLSKRLNCSINIDEYEMQSQLDINAWRDHHPNTEVNPCMATMCNFIGCDA